MQTCGGCWSKRMALLMTWTLGVARPRCFRISTMTSARCGVVSYKRHNNQVKQGAVQLHQYICFVLQRTRQAGRKHKDWHLGSRAKRHHVLQPRPPRDRACSHHGGDVTSAELRTHQHVVHLCKLACMPNLNCTNTHRSPPRFHVWCFFGLSQCGADLKRVVLGVERINVLLGLGCGSTSVHIINNHTLSGSCWLLATTACDVALRLLSTQYLVNVQSGWRASDVI